jgi:hypothetical protein
VDDRVFLRIQEVSVTYQLPNTITSKLGLGRTSASLSAQNLVWFDDCNCYDPGMASQAGAAGDSGASASTTAIYGNPQPRTFAFTLRTTF